MILAGDGAAHLVQAKVGPVRRHTLRLPWVPPQVVTVFPQRTYTACTANIRLLQRCGSASFWGRYGSESDCPFWCRSPIRILLQVGKWEKNVDLYRYLYRSFSLHLFLFLVSVLAPCSGSVRFWYGSGSSDPCLWLTVTEQTGSTTLMIITNESANYSLLWVIRFLLRLPFIQLIFFIFSDFW